MLVWRKSGQVQELGRRSARNAAVAHAAPSSRRSGDLELPAGSLRRLRLLGPRGQDVVLVRSDRAVLVAIAHLVAVAEGDALRGEERPEERRHGEDLVADELEQPADLP